MSFFFHVDRRQNLEEGKTLELFQNPIEKFLEVFGDLPNYQKEIEANNIEELISDRFPEGLSMHGLRYVIGESKLWNHQKQDKYMKTRSAFYIEHMYEQIRRNSFSNKQSRFQSWYAWDNKFKACNFPDALDTPFDVYRVEPSDWIKLDMALLKYGNYGKVLRMARKYWLGEETRQPQIEVLMEPPINVKEKVQTVRPSD